LLAALELGLRFVSLALEERIIITTPQDAANLLSSEMSILDQEHLRVILLNTRNEVLSTYEIYVGNVNSSMVRPAEIFRPAVRANAPSLIVVHNHPSGNPGPSDGDIAIT
jgi:DNA repair protein RadC